MILVKLIFINIMMKGIIHVIESWIVLDLLSLIDIH